MLALARAHTTDLPPPKSSGRFEDQLRADDDGLRARPTICRPQPEERRSQGKRVRIPCPDRTLPLHSLTPLELVCPSSPTPLPPLSTPAGRTARRYRDAPALPGSGRFIGQRQGRRWVSHRKKPLVLCGASVSPDGLPLTSNPAPPSSQTAEHRRIAGPHAGPYASLH